MEDILIPCPECGKELRLRDPKLLGRIGKCPKCSHRFKLEEPDEVELELADAAAVPVGTSAQWVPDGQPASARAVSTTAAPAASTVGAFPEESSSPASMRNLRSSRKKKPDKVKIAVIGGSIVSAIAVVVVIVMAMSGSSTKKNEKNTKGDTAANEIEGNNPQDDPPDLIANQNENQAATEGDKPPTGQPITLNFIPTGARMIIHIRPAEMWKTGSDAETVRLCLGSLSGWTETKLTEILLFKPSEIEEATICLYLDDRNAPPEVAYRVKLTDQHPRSEFVDKFGGKPNTDHGRKIYVTEESDEKPATAYMIIDRKGQEFASAPKFRAKEMVDAEQSPGLAFGGLDQLLKRTDDRRHVTFLFAPSDLRNSKKFLFHKNADKLLGQFLDRFEDTKMDTMAWNFHFGNNQYNKFYSEILLRNKSNISSHELKVDMNRKLQNLAGELFAAVRQMTPITVAHQKMVGRLPAMSHAFYIQTTAASAGSDERWVRLTTVLPKVAGPNLAAGSMYAYQLALDTKFKAPVKQSTSKKIPDLIADRLKLPVDVDFRRLPLQEAIDYIKEEIHTRIEIDGDALKDAGYTKNMPQVMNLGTVSAIRAFAAILKQYDKMVISVDEQRKMIIVTTAKFAAKNGQPPFELPK